MTITEHNEDHSLQRLWEEYGQFLRNFDDLTLARWMVQTLGQFEGFVWRLSHPLVGAYKLAAVEAEKRGIWQRRLISPPPAYPIANCCAAPLLPVVTRDVVFSGLICTHCGGTAVPFEELAESHRKRLGGWAERYAPVHEVAHWDEAKKKSCGNYTEVFDKAAEHAESLLVELAVELVPLLLEDFPALIWEDHDECLDVRAEDLDLS